MDEQWMRDIDVPATWEWGAVVVPSPRYWFLTFFIPSGRVVMQFRTENHWKHFIKNTSVGYVSISCMSRSWVIAGAHAPKRRRYYSKWQKKSETLTSFVLRYAKLPLLIFARVYVRHQTRAMLWKVARLMQNIFYLTVIKCISRPPRGPSNTLFYHRHAVRIRDLRSLSKVTWVV